MGPKIRYSYGSILEGGRWLEKRRHEQGRYLTYNDDFGTDRNPSCRAIDRHQNHARAVIIDRVRGSGLFWNIFFKKFIGQVVWIYGHKKCPLTLSHRCKLEWFCFINSGKEKTFGGSVYWASERRGLLTEDHLCGENFSIGNKVFNLSIFTEKCQSAKKIWQKLQLFFYMSNNVKATKENFLNPPKTQNSGY